MTISEIIKGKEWYLCIYEWIAEAYSEAFFFNLLFWYPMQKPED
jgi:hypothetical protein